MDNIAARAVAAYFDTQGLRYAIEGEKKDLILINFILKNNIRQNLLLEFSEDSKTVKISAMIQNSKFKDDKKPKMYEICSKLNEYYKWATFFVNERENFILIKDDAVIQLDSCGEECLTIIKSMNQIVKESYPVIMDAIRG